jgi:hypothetical protein
MEFRIQRKPTSATATSHGLLGLSQRAAVDDCYSSARP